MTVRERRSLGYNIVGSAQMHSVTWLQRLLCTWHVYDCGLVSCQMGVGVLLCVVFWTRPDGSDVQLTTSRVTKLCAYTESSACLKQTSLNDICSVSSYTITSISNHTNQVGHFFVRIG